MIVDCHPTNVAMTKPQRALTTIAGNVHSQIAAQHAMELVSLGVQPWRATGVLVRCGSTTKFVQTSFKIH